MIRDGLAIVLAWPETFCKQPGSWYDSLMNFLGVSKNHYYRVGHAAIVLVNKSDNSCHYFDFGRYHAPFGFGRVRGGKNDPELKMQSKAEFDQNNQLLNYNEILHELSTREACHGDGALFASQVEISFADAYHKAMEMQNKEFIPYGPFIRNGTNCSRFVRSVAVAGNPSWLKKLALKFPYTPAPTPKGNVLKGKNRKEVQSPLNIKVEVPKLLPKEGLYNTLTSPNRPNNISKDAIWLSGEGAGSWFEVLPADTYLTMNRYNPTGLLECNQRFASNKQFDAQNPYTLGYPSHCNRLTIFQEGKKITLNPL